MTTNTEILENAPTLATHIDVDGTYWRVEKDEEHGFTEHFYYFGKDESNTDCWCSSTPDYLTRSLDDIKGISALRRCRDEALEALGDSNPDARYDATEILLGRG